VDVLGQRPLVVDQGKAVAGAGEPDAGPLVVAERDAGLRRDRRVEAPRGLQVADAEPQVVDAAVRDRLPAIAVDGLDALPSGSSRKPP